MTLREEAKGTMEIKVRSVEPHLILMSCRGVLSQPLNGEANDPLRGLLSNLNWGGDVLLDMHHAEYAVTGGIAWLVKWQRQVEKSGGTFGLVAVPPRIREMLELCYLNQVIPMWETEAAARAALVSARSQLVPEGPAETPEAVPPQGAAPLVPIEARVTAVKKPSPNGPTEVRPESGVTITVLVVDDSAVERLRAANALKERFGRELAETHGHLQVVQAANGREALRLIPQTPPDLVVTDMMMPEMDGLALVTEVRAAHPAIPVVLMTAHGSEEIAAKALRAGAASYVPKKNLSRDLAETVETIVRLAQTKRERQLILQHLTVQESQFRLPTQLSLIAPLVSVLQGNLKRLGLCHPADELRVTIALREALMNAFTHGNLEVPGDMRETDYDGYLHALALRQSQSPYRDRHVHVYARETPDEVIYVVRDEGAGFNTAALPDPTCSDNLRKAGGRGLFLIRTFMDEVRFNEAGNEITLIKRRSA
jgi:CheY-like chemotaxis protein/anti-sigma regulatory factor (Ser/Thr protein kinase)/anti-anti-sigma regulatory factor